MSKLPNPWISDSAPPADTVAAPRNAPALGAAAELIQPATGELVSRTPDGLSFQPDFEKLFDEIMDSLPPKFLSHPSAEYLAALPQSGSSHADDFTELERRYADGVHDYRFARTG